MIGVRLRMACREARALKCHYVHSKEVVACAIQKGWYGTYVAVPAREALVFYVVCYR